MPVEPSLPESALLAVLRDVSRSFYLSIRLLPAALRAPVVAGYLLARTSDTVADTPGIPCGDRLRMLAQFEDDVRGACPASPIPAAKGASSGEVRLLAAFPECVAWLHRLAPADRDDVLAVLAAITRGQRLDLERFGGGPARLASAAELDEYTYLVAGSVGEFWTRLGMRHMPGFATLGPEEMLALGRRYGMALQLVNVLRDEQEDLAQGRGYLPSGTPREEWIARAHEGLECGLRYCLALTAGRVRLASALPALIGVRTLRLVREAPPHAPRVKVRRAAVRGLLARLALSFASPASIEREFRRWDNRPR